MLTPPDASLLSIKQLVRVREFGMFEMNAKVRHKLTGAAGKVMQVVGAGDYQLVDVDIGQGQFARWPIAVVVLESPPVQTDNEKRLQGYENKLSDLKGGQNSN